MKLNIADIPAEGLEMVFVKNSDETTTFLNDPRKEVTGGPDGLHVELVVEMVKSTVLVRGEVKASLQAICGRCLGGTPVEVVAAVDAALFPKSGSGFEDDLELSEDDLDALYYEGPEIDLSDQVREAIFLEMPHYPGCSEEEAEACPLYQEFVSQQRQHAPKASKGDDIDPRWSALLAMKANMASGEDKD